MSTTAWVAVSAAVIVVVICVTLAFIADRWAKALEDEPEPLHGKPPRTVIEKRRAKNAAARKARKRNR